MLSVLKNTCRERITMSDWQFVRGVVNEHLVMEDGEGEVGKKGEEGVDYLLDDPKVLEAILEQSRGLGISLFLYFYVIMRHLLLNAGFEDRLLADYLSRVLVFGHKVEAEEPNFLCPSNAPVVYVVDVLSSIQEAKSPEDFYLSLQLSNHLLILTSIFSEYLNFRKQHKASPPIKYYESTAMFYYGYTSSHPMANKFNLAHVLHTISDRFVELKKVLFLLKNEYLFIDGLHLK